MSITFKAPAAPRVVVAVDYGEGEELEVRSELPEVNMSETTTAAMLRALELPDRPYGCLTSEALDAAIHRATLLANLESLGSFTCAASATTGPMRAWKEQDGSLNIGRTVAITDFGISEERIRRCLQELLQLFVAARKRGYAVEWG